MNVLSGCSSLVLIHTTLTDSPSHSAELKSLGPDFVFGFVQAVDGERDPRNLLLAFQIARNIIHRGYDFSEYSFVDKVMHSLIVSDCNTKCLVWNLGQIR